MIRFIYRALLAFLNSIYFFFFPTFYESKGKAILVTGAASGIGKASVQELLVKGCFVFAGDVNIKLLQEEFGTTPNVKILKLDVTSQEDVNKAQEIVKKEGKGLYGVVNSAGVSKPPSQTGKIIEARLVAEVNVEKDVFPVVDINTFGTMRINSAFFPLILDSKGCIVNIVSLAGRIATPGIGVYNTSKFALTGYSSTLRRELAPLGVRVVAIEPGFVDTPMTYVFKDPEIKFDYSKSVFKPNEDNAKKLRQGIAENMISAKEVSSAVYHSLFSARPTPHLVVDKPIAKPFYIALSTLPYSWQDFVLDYVRGVQ